MDVKLLRACLAELLGTFALVLVGAGTACAAALTAEPRLDVTAVALAEGLTLAVVLTATYRVSGGGFNPALTLMLWVFRRIDGRKLAGFIVAQLLGAFLAGLVLRVTFPDDVLTTHLGTPHLRAFQAPDGGVTLAGILSGIGFETFFTALLAFAFLATLADRRGPGVGGRAVLLAQTKEPHEAVLVPTPAVGGLVVGLAQAAIILFGARLTGGAANPARWGGPAVWEVTLVGNRALADHTVYWVGPVVGALLGGFLYALVVRPPDERPGPEGA
jgi:glycerol uptake facilitator-like aquaporin